MLTRALKIIPFIYRSNDAFSQELELLLSFLKYLIIANWIAPQNNSSCSSHIQFHCYTCCSRNEWRRVFAGVLFLYRWKLFSGRTRRTIVATSTVDLVEHICTLLLSSLWTLYYPGKLPSNPLRVPFYLLLSWEWILTKEVAAEGRWTINYICYLFIVEFRSKEYC